MVLKQEQLVGVVAVVAEQQPEEPEREQEAAVSCRVEGPESRAISISERAPIGWLDDLDSERQLEESVQEPPPQQQEASLVAGEELG